MKQLKLLVLVLFLIVQACQKDDSNFNGDQNNCEDCNFSYVKDENRLEIVNSSITLQDKGITSRTGETLELNLKAILAPLTIDYQGEETLLNANHVTVRNRRVAASYSIVGEPYGGAIDIIDLPNNKNPSLEGTLLIPDKDVDFVEWNSRTKLLFGGGLNMATYPEAASASTFEYYGINDTRKTGEFSLTRIKEYNEHFGNKLNKIGKVNGKIAGSGGGSNGSIFVYDKNSNQIYKDESGMMTGLYIMDFTQAKNGSENKMAVMAYDNTSKELKLFYYKVKSKELVYDFNVSLGNWDLNIEAKHSIRSPKKDILFVSLEQNGVGVFEIGEDNGEKTATMIQQVKDDMLDPSNPDEVVNSFSYSNKKLWVAGGAAGVLILNFNTNTNILEYKFQVEVPGESVNSILKNGDNLVVASTSGVRIFDTNN